MNLINWIEREMATDDESREVQSVKLRRLYDAATPTEREMLDMVFIALCGWSLTRAIESADACVQCGDEPCDCDHGDDGCNVDDHEGWRPE